MDLAAIDPSEPMLERIVLQDGASMRLRSVAGNASMWTVTISVAAYDRLRRTFKIAEPLNFLCMEIGNSWMTAQILGVMDQPPRGRHGPYDIVFSASQWRDFGSTQERDLFESAAVYFSTDSAASSTLISAVRDWTARTAAAPNTRLIQPVLNASRLR
jgi:hypothetical protein